MRRIILLFATLVVASACLAATLPKVINYQGKLTNSSGVALNGLTDITFRIYTAASGGSAIWTEARTGGSAVSVTNGLFDVQLVN